MLIFRCISAFVRRLKCPQCGEQIGANEYCDVCEVFRAHAPKDPTDDSGANPQSENTIT